MSESKLRTIPGAPRYVADDQGRIYGPRGAMLVQAPNQHGYPAVGLRLDGRRRTRPVHVLVCAAFHGPKPTAAHEVRHLDGSRTNNRAANLVWGTRSENALDRSAHGRSYRPDWWDSDKRGRWSASMRAGKRRARDPSGKRYGACPECPSVSLRIERNGKICRHSPGFGSMERVRPPFLAAPACKGSGRRVAEDLTAAIAAATGGEQ